MKPKPKSEAEVGQGHSPLPAVWGLTGGIASGKSTAARFFVDSGIPVIDADQIVRELGSEGGAAYPLIINRFGTADRKKLRAMVFNDAKARHDLEAILHPLIHAESWKRIDAAAAAQAEQATTTGREPVVLYEAALLIESGRYHELRGLIVVTSNETLRLERLVKRDHITQDLGQKILSAQLPDSERLAHAAHLLENDGTLDDLRRQVNALIPALS